jgi:hypothetical protein
MDAARALIHLWPPKVFRNWYPQGKEGARLYRQYARSRWDDWYQDVRQARRDETREAYEKGLNDCFYCPRCGKRNTTQWDTVPGFGLCYDCTRYGESHRKDHQRIRRAYVGAAPDVVATVRFLLMICGDIESFLDRGEPLAWRRKAMPAAKRKRYARNRAARAKLPFLEWYNLVNRDGRIDGCTSSRRLSSF